MDTSYNTFDDVKNQEMGELSEKADEDKTGYTMNEAVEHIGFGLFQLKITAIVCLSWMVNSMELMVLTILGPVLLCVWDIFPGQEALIPAVFFVGFSVGSPIIGFLSDMFGRKIAMILAAIWAGLFGMIGASAPFYVWLVVLRGLTGLGISGLGQSVTYLAEFLPQKYRAKAIIFLEFFFDMGGILEVALAIGVLEPAGWRWWLVTSSIPLLLFAPTVLSIPESPRYLLAAGKIEQAQKILEEVALTNKTTLPPGKLQAEPPRERARFSDLLAPSLRWSTILLWVIWFVTQLNYYGVILLASGLIQADIMCIKDHPFIPPSNHTNETQCDSLSTKDYTQIMWTTVSEIPALALALIYVDRIGRREALAINLFLYSVTLFLFFICGNMVSLVILLFCGRGFAAVALQMAYVYTPEIYPTTVRSLGMGAGMVFATLGTLVTPFISEVLTRTSLAAVISLYGTLGLVSAVAAMCLPIETRGREMKTAVD